MQVKTETKLSVTFAKGEFSTEIYRESSDYEDYVKIKQGDDYVWIPVEEFADFLRALTEWSPNG